MIAFASWRHHYLYLLVVDKVNREFEYIAFLFCLVLFGNRNKKWVCIQCTCGFIIFHYILLPYSVSFPPVTTCCVCVCVCVCVLCVCVCVCVCVCEHVSVWACVHSVHFFLFQITKPPTHFRIQYCSSKLHN